MQRGVSTGAPAAPPGVWQTIAIAFSALLVAPLPILLPIVVDAYLALGPRFSPAALTVPLARELAEQGQAGIPEASGLIASVEGLAAAADMAATVGWFVPSLLAATDRSGFPNAVARPVVDLASTGGSALLWLAFVVLGVFAGMLFAVLLARTVRGAPLVDDTLAVEALRAGARYLALLLLAMAVVVAVLVPAAVVSVVSALTGFDLLAFVVFVLTVGAVVVAVLTSFVAEAIAYSGAGPLRAIRLSVDVVRRSLWPSIGLQAVLLTVLLILPLLLGEVTGNGVGFALAIAVYAAVATGTSLARMQFFADRVGASQKPVVSSQ